MQGQEQRKRTRAVPGLGCGAGEGEENEGGDAGDNLPRIAHAQHPLSIDLVMEVLFKKFLLLDHDDPRNSAVEHLAKLRPVCKAWDKEIVKMIQKDRRINVNRLLKPYPQGMGWAATTSTGFGYQVTMPESIVTYENLKVAIKSCKDFGNVPVLKWFQVMGSSVKSLHLVCPLSCWHQHRFVELILKKWCPNLESFQLQGVQTFESLIRNSFFTEPSLENQCKSLKIFILSLDSLQWDSWRSEWTQWTDFCGQIIEDLESPEEQKFQSVDNRKLIYERFSTFSECLIRYVDRGGIEGIPIDNLLNDLVRRPIGLTSVAEMTPRTFGSHNAKFFQEKFMCDPGYETDGGIIGRLMRMGRIDKFVIENMKERPEWFFNELFAMFFYRPNLWSSSLQDFQCLGYCPAIFARSNHIHSWFPEETIPKEIFSRVGFPLKRLKFATWCLWWGERLVPMCMDGILRGCAETLEELEIELEAKGNSKLILPKLPRLKIFVLHMYVDRVVRLTSEDILRNLPNLERCEVKLGSRRERRTSANGFFGGGDGLWRDIWCQSHPLKELKVLDEYLEKNDIERMVLGFPNLKSVDLSIVQTEGVDDFKRVWEEMSGLSRLERVKISFKVKKLEVNWDKECDLYEKAIADNVEGFKALQWLELEHKGRHPFLLTGSLTKGIAKATKLRFLKFTNFEVDSKVVEGIKKNIPDVATVFHHPDVWISCILKAAA